MKLVIQRVNHAAVRIDGAVVGSIDKGLLVLIGIAEDDTTEILNHFVDKLVKLRIFEDADGKTNLSLGDVGGALLLVSQFTLYADCRKGNRPSFVKAGAPEMASAMYEAFIAKCRERVPVVQTGRFGADMKVELENDGPFTIIFDSREM
jgi:D-tyrosyl-tRNA(Tyr) deacylase